MKFFSKASGGGASSSLEKQLKEATSTETWNVPNSQLHAIAMETHDPNDCNIITTHCMGILTDVRKRDKKDEWRRIYKALVLLETLLKHGSERCIEDIRGDIWRIQQWKEYRFMEKGKDLAGGIREKAAVIAELVNDARELQREREKAHALSQKMTGMGTTVSTRKNRGNDTVGPSPSAFHSPFEKEKRNKRRTDDGGFSSSRAAQPTEGEKNQMIEKFCMVTSASRMAAREYLERSHYDVHQAINMYLGESTGEGSQGRGKQPGWFESKKRIESVMNVTKVTEERASELLEQSGWDVGAAINKHLSSGGGDHGGSTGNYQSQPPSRQNQRDASPSSSSSGSSSDSDDRGRGPKNDSGTFGGPSVGQSGWPSAGYGQGKGGFPGGPSSPGNYSGSGFPGGKGSPWPSSNSGAAGPGGWPPTGGMPGKGGGPWGGGFGDSAGKGGSSGPFGGPPGTSGFGGGGGPPGASGFGGGGGPPGSSSFGSSPQGNPWGPPSQGLPGASSRSLSAGPSYGGSQGSQMGGQGSMGGTPWGGGGSQPGGCPGNKGGDVNPFGGGKGGDPYGNNRNSFGGVPSGGPFGTPGGGFGGPPGGQGGFGSGSQGGAGGFGSGSQGGAGGFGKGAGFGNAPGGGFGGGMQKGGGGFGAPPGGGFGNQAAFGGGGGFGAGAQPFGGGGCGGKGG